MEEDTDPGWTKPKKSFRLKKTIPRGRPVLGTSSANRTLPVVPSQSVKRRNSFEKEDAENLNNTVDGPGAKRQKLGSIFSSSSMFSPSSTFLQNKALPSALQRRISESTQSNDSRDSGVLSDFSCSSPDTEPGDGRLAQPPLDWSLKTRLRVVSPTNLGWSSHLSTVEEASGVTGGVRCVSLTGGEHCLDTSTNAQFHSWCLYWQHPCLPMAGQLFPRYTQSAATRPLASAGPVLSLSPDMQRALHSDWMTSLQSVYQLVKARQCPFFYLLAPNFSVLFRAAGVEGGQQMTALVTPTSTGVRAALKREEIEFSLPLFRGGGEEEEAGSQPECDSTNEFLESLGIEADSLPGLSSHAPKNRLAAGAGSSQNIDGRPESLALVEGVECQSLLNYLLNAKLVAGKDQLPPTLLAPVAYHGATLRSLRVRAGQVGGAGRGPGAQHSVELTGPVLPHMVQGLARLAASSAPRFSLTAHTLEETVSLSMFRGEDTEAAPSAFGTASLDDCGLDPETLKVFCSRRTAPAAPSPDEAGQVVRDLAYSGGGYTVNTQSVLGKKQ